jgi:hypothetical protein
VNRWEAAGDLLGHEIKSQSRKYGATTHHWVECSCGYKSEPGKSVRFAISSGIGHIKRVRQRLEGVGLVSSGEIETTREYPASQTTKESVRRARVRSRG